MQILSIEFKNLTSYGNQIQKLEFDDTGFLWLLSAPNGLGKSSIAIAIKFALFGKLDGVNLPDLPNRINKNLWVKIKIVCKGKILEIERGLSPGLFKVIINGVEFDQAGKLNTQDYLEDELFEIPYNVFKNIIVISINDFKSFLTMNPGDKKNIIDKLFGFSIINEMLNSVKKDRRTIEEKLNSLNDDLTLIIESIESINLKIKNLEEKNESKNKEKIISYKEKLKEFSENKNKLIEAKTKINNLNVLLQNKISDSSKILSSKKNIHYNALDKLKLYSQNKCPHCESDLTGEFGSNLKVHYEDIVNKIPSEIEVLDKEIKSTSLIISENTSKLHQIISKVSSLETNINNFKNELVQLVSKGSSDEFDQLKQLVNENNLKIEEKSSVKSNYSDEDYYLQILEKMFGENGIKNLAMKTIIPSLNNEILYLLKEIHLPFTIKFDEKFDCKVMSLGEEINPKTMSTGERKRADFIIIIAMIKLIKLRYPSINLLFLDEIFSGVDQVGIHDIIEILNKSIKEMGLNTIIIHHAQLPETTFDKRISISKNNGFSNITISDMI